MGDTACRGGPVVQGGTEIAGDPGSTPVEYRLDSYDYGLPRDLIAQAPATPRDSARLLRLPLTGDALTHHVVQDLPGLLRPGDLLIANRTRVIPARLKARKVETGGQVELLLLGQTDETWWEALVGGHRIRAGQRVELGRSGGVLAEIGGRTESGRLVRFEGAADVPSILREYGAMPLPPYIQGYEGDVARYQTVYAEVDGSVAAPTAGLHFTPELLAALEQRGVAWATVILHVGIGTFKGVSEADVRQHHLHPEWVEIDPSVVDAVGEARRRGGRVIAVGTTTTRALEHAAAGGKFGAYCGPADLFITPGHHFHVIDGLLTNFHLPKSSLLLLVSALASRERVLAAYLEAVRLRYRFYSFGDAMLIL